MALLKSKRSEVPENAVLLTEQQALKYQLETIKNWPKVSDVFAIKYGMYILGGATFLSGLYMNNYFRKKFLLGAYGRLSTYLPICLVPGSASLIIHSQTVLPDLMLMKGDCPVCLQLRAASIQTFLGTVFPSILAPLGCAAVAQRYSTYYLPSLPKNYREVFAEFSKMFKPIKSNIWYIFLGQALLGSIVTYFEAKSVININQKLAMEQEELPS